MLRRLSNPLLKYVCLALSLSAVFFGVNGGFSADAYTVPQTAELTLARDPVLIMLDEPTAGLDSEETRAIVQLIKQVTEKKTLVIVEHDMDVVFDLADRITVINYGKVLATGYPDEIRENEEVKKAYLGRK